VKFSRHPNVGTPSVPTSTHVGRIFLAVLNFPSAGLSPLIGFRWRVLFIWWIVAADHYAASPSPLWLLHPAHDPNQPPSPPPSSRTSTRDCSSAPPISPARIEPVPAKR